MDTKQAAINMKAMEYSLMLIVADTSAAAILSVFNLVFTSSSNQLLYAKRSEM